MSYCCVPLCKSDEKKKTPGLSFHEIPADPKLRETWISAIRRDDWTPNTTSCYTKVCSRHFKKDDFMEGKRRRLRKGVVPSVFEDFPGHLRQKRPPERSTASITKRLRCSEGVSSMRDDASQPDVSVQTCSTTQGECVVERPSLDAESEPEELQRAVSSACDQGVQVDTNSASTLLAAERCKWKRKERVTRLRKTVDRYKSELAKLKEDSLSEDLSYIKTRGEEKQPAALFLLDQIRNFRKKRPTWSEETIRRCVVLRHLSTRAYEHMRGEQLLKLPSRNTLANYIGMPNGETGFSKLVESRLKMEASSLPTPQSMACSLIIDEMRIAQKLQYHKQQDCFVGQADIVAEDKENGPVLANSLLCFVLNGLSTSFRIPASYFFTKGLTGAQLHKLIVFVMKKVESCGFKIQRLVTDNHKVNVNAMKLLGSGVLTYRVEHPCDKNRLLFLSFDPCHILKNVRSQFLAHDIGPDGEISSRHIKKLYELQKKMIIKPVRYLSRKHVFPNNIEKMNVARAVQVLSPDVTAALEYLKDQAGHCCDTSFAAAGPSITFMKNFYRWFILHDTSNTTQHIHQRFPDVRHFDDIDDSRLEWLEASFPMYIEELRKRCKGPREFLTRETYEAHYILHRGLHPPSVDKGKIPLCADSQIQQRPNRITVWDTENVLWMQRHA